MTNSDDHSTVEARFNTLLNNETAAPKPMTYWLSFADPAKPKGSQFLGVVCVKAIGPMHAIQRTNELGLNPGGQVEIHAVYDHIRDEDLERVLSRHYIENEMEPNGG